MDIKKLGEICAIVSGGTPSRTNTEFWDGGTIPWIKIGDIKEKHVSKADEYITQAGLDGSSAKMLSKGTILYTIFATLGEAGILTTDACTNQAIAGITIRNQNEVLTDYLYYYLKSKKSYVNNLGRGVAQNNINLSILRNLDVPLPDLPTQQQTVDVLDETVKVIKYRQQQLQKLDDLVKARFVEMFGDSEFNTMQWPTKKLSELCAVSSSKRIYQNEQSTEGVPFLRISDLNERIDNVKNAPELFIPINKYNELKENGLVPTEGDILVTSRGTLGRCYIVRPEDEFYFQDGMISWLSDLNSQITSVYLSQLFAMSGIQKQIASLQAGSTVAYLSITMLKKLNIMLPPLDRQEQFAAFVEQTDKSKVAVQKALDEAQLLFDSLMQKYFG